MNDQNHETNAALKNESVTHVSEEFSVWYESSEVSVGHALEAEALAGDLQEASLESLVDVYECLDLLENVWPTEIPKNQAPGREIGPYRLTHKLGSGGMGDVWAAEQTDPIARTLAIKLIRNEVLSKAARERFEAERQTLAMMDHPAIARIIDVGTTESGQPYFAMELVDGVALTTYCDDRLLSIRERLELFCRVCEGVQHAHQKGIIHRDLKPGNILVTEYDGIPAPKIIDFGLSKAMESTPKLNGKSIDTKFGQVLGTIKYMSPEQAGLGSQDIDTRTDIYALGVVLYELLTGSTPLDSSSIRDDALVKILELVREHEAPKPSSKISTSANSERISKISTRRKIGAKRLASILAGELDWVVMKSLEKDRNRRYSSATEFAEDIKRYLNQEPILARPPSRSYRLRKFVRKNRGLVASMATIAALLIAGIGGTTWFAVGQKAARELAQNNESLANANAEQSRMDKIVAEEAAKRSTAAMQIFTDSFRSIDPGQGADSKMSAKDVLLRAYEKLKSSDLDNEGKSKLLKALTNSFSGIGEYAEALSAAHLLLEIDRKTFGSEHPETLIAMNNVATSYSQLGRHAEALELQQEVLKFRQTSLGPEHSSTLISMQNLAMSYGALGKHGEAIKLKENVLDLQREKIGLEHLETLTTMHNLAGSYIQLGQFGKAKKLQQEVLELQRAHLGVDHPNTLLSMNNLAFCYNQLGKIEKGLELQEQILELQQNKLGATHPNTLLTSHNLAGSYSDMGRHRDALPLQKRVLELRRKKLGVEHPDTQMSMNVLWYTLDQVGHVKEALALKHELFNLQRDKQGLNHANTITTMHNLAHAYGQLELYDEALKLQLEVVDLLKAKRGPEHADTLLAMNNLAYNYSRQNKHDEALKLLEDILVIEQSKLGPQHEDVLLSLHNLGVAHVQAGKLERAIELFQRALKGRTKTLGDQHPSTLTTMGFLSQSLLKSENFDSAEKLLRQYFDIRFKSNPDDWQTFSTQVLLGIAQAGQREFESAKLNLTEGYQGIKSRSSSKNPFLKNALEHLISLAESSSNAEDLKKWQAERKRIENEKNALEGKD